MVEWDEEEGNVTPVQQKQLVGGHTPEEGDRTSVKEARTGKVFHGMVIKKGKVLSKTGVIEMECTYQCEPPPPIGNRWGN